MVYESPLLHSLIGVKHSILPKTPYFACLPEAGTYIRSNLILFDKWSQILPVLIFLLPPSRNHLESPTKISQSYQKILKIVAQYLR